VKKGVDVKYMNQSNSLEYNGNHINLTHIPFTAKSAEFDHKYPPDFVAQMQLNQNGIDDVGFMQNNQSRLHNYNLHNN
jgi:hypothetical protein